MVMTWILFAIHKSYSFEICGGTFSLYFATILKEVILIILRDVVIKLEKLENCQKMNNSFHDFPHFHPDSPHSSDSQTYSRIPALSFLVPSFSNLIPCIPLIPTHRSKHFPLFYPDSPHSHPHSPCFLHSHPPFLAFPSITPWFPAFPPTISSHFPDLEPFSPRSYLYFLVVLSFPPLFPAFPSPFPLFSLFPSWFPTPAFTVSLIKVVTKTLAVIKNCRETKMLGTQWHLEVTISNL